MNRLECRTAARLLAAGAVFSALVSGVSGQADAALMLDIQPVSICLDNGTSCGALSYNTAELKTFWLTEAGITLNILPSRIFDSTTYQAMDSFSEVEQFIVASPSPDPLGPSGMATSPITIWFSDGTAVRPTIGLGLIDSNRSWVDATLAGGDETATMAHELGHNLGLWHVYEFANLMAPTFSLGTDLLRLRLDDSQAATVQASAFVYSVAAAVPAPPTLILLLTGLAALVWRRRVPAAGAAELTPACA